MVGDSPLQCLVLDLKENKLLAILHPKVSAPWKTQGWGLHFLYASSVLASNHAPCAHFFPFHFQKERKGKKEKKREKNYLFTVRWVSKGCGLSILGDIQTLTGTWTGDPQRLSRGLDQMTSRGSLPPQPFCHAYIDDNRLTLSLEEKDNRIHVGPEEIQESS